VSDIDFAVDVKVLKDDNMSEKKIKNKVMSKMREAHFVPANIAAALGALAEEDVSYAADEVVSAGEEVLSFFTGLGIMIYLNGGKQTEKNNQRILEIFYGLDRQNAGPLFYNVCRMVKPLETEAAKKFKSKVLKKSTAKEPEFVLVRDEIVELTMLRNRVMHGFFIAPAQKNIEEAGKLCRLSEELFLVIRFFRRR